MCMKKKESKKEPATKEDIKLLEKSTQEDLEIWGGNLLFEIEESRQENNKRFDKQDKVLASILSVIQMLVGQLAEVKGTPEKVENHEKRITDLEVQVRMGRR